MLCLCEAKIEYVCWTLIVWLTQADFLFVGKGGEPEHLDSRVFGETRLCRRGCLRKHHSSIKYGQFPLVEFVEESGVSAQILRGEAEDYLS